MYIHGAIIGAAKSKAAYVLEYGTQVARSKKSTLLGSRRRGKQLIVNTGPLEAQFDARRSGFPTRIRFDANGDREFAKDEELVGPIGAEVTDVNSDRYTSRSPAHSIEIEEAGPVRIVVKTTGHHKAEQDRRMFTYTNRFTFYAGSPLWTPTRRTAT